MSLPSHCVVRDGFCEGQETFPHPTQRQRREKSAQGRQKRAPSSESRSPLPRAGRQAHRKAHHWAQKPATSNRCHSVAAPGGARFQARTTTASGLPKREPPPPSTGQQLLKPPTPASITTSSKLQARRGRLLWLSRLSRWIFFEGGVVFLPPFNRACPPKNLPPHQPHRRALSHPPPFLLASPSRRLDRLFLATAQPPRRRRVPFPSLHVARAGPISQRQPAQPRARPALIQHRLQASTDRRLPSAAPSLPPSSRSSAQLKSSGLCHFPLHESLSSRN